MFFSHSFIAPKDSCYRSDSISLGLGNGLDYGDPIGLRLGFNVAEHMGFFLAVGVWGGRISPSGGLKSRFLPKPQVTLCPYIVGVYGSTEVVSYHYFIGRPLFSKGLSFGGGFDFF